MKTVILNHFSKFNGVWYATFKCLFGFNTKQLELLGVDSMVLGKAYATVTSQKGGGFKTVKGVKVEKPPAKWVLGGVYSNVQWTPLEDYEMKHQPHYNADNELQGNRAKPTCQFEFTEKTELIHTFDMEEIDAMPDSAEE